MAWIIIMCVVTTRKGLVNWFERLEEQSAGERAALWRHLPFIIHIVHSCHDRNQYPFILSVRVFSVSLRIFYSLSVFGLKDHLESRINSLVLSWDILQMNALKLHAAFTFLPAHAIWTMQCTLHACTYMKTTIFVELMHSLHTMKWYCNAKRYLYQNWSILKKPSIIWLLIFRCCCCSMPLL